MKNKEHSDQNPEEHPAAHLEENITDAPVIKKPRTRKVKKALAEENAELNIETTLASEGQKAAETLVEEAKETQVDMLVEQVGQVITETQADEVTEIQVDSASEVQIEGSTDKQIDEPAETEPDMAVESPVSEATGLQGDSAVDVPVDLVAEVNADAPEVPAPDEGRTEKIATEEETVQDAELPRVDFMEEELHPGLEPGADAMEELSAAEEQAVMQLAETSEENYNKFSREELVEELERLVQNEDLNAIKTQMALIKVAFLKLGKEERQQKIDAFVAAGGNREEYVMEEDAVDERFKTAFNIYKEKKIKFNEEQEQEKLRNLEAKKQIIEKLKELIASDETLKKTYDEFRALQDEWKLIGMVPRTEANELWQNYHFLVEKFFDKVKINKELKDLDLRKNMEAKIAICEKSEALLLETSLLKSFKLLQQYHDEWHSIGPVPQDKRDEIWNRFKDATDKINERRREYYDQIRGEHENNLMAKRAICDQAEKLLSVEISSVKQWQEVTDQINELQKMWRSVGAAPKPHNDEIWQRFKTYIDTFFANKKEYFTEIKEEQVHNYNLKLDLCVQAENLKTSTDWKHTTSEFKRLQEEWRNIGPVPRKFSDKIWKRFRAACDEFFSTKSNYFRNIQSIEGDNLKKKEDLIKLVAEYEFTGDKKENLEILNNFQREWMAIGHVPMKDKDRLNSEFRTAINRQLDKLKISSVEMNTVAYRNKYEHIAKDSPDGNRIIVKEKFAISQKINKIQEEINLWENNIGFLANSKNAQILKEEFLKKIDRAKDEIRLLEVKLKMLKEV